jgi:hypothetical protein
VVAGRSLPDSLPHGLVDDSRAYVVNFPQGGRYCRLEAEREAELREAAREFGRLAGVAIRKKFLVSP